MSRFFFSFPTFFPASQVFSWTCVGGLSFLLPNKKVENTFEVLWTSCEAPSDQKKVEEKESGKEKHVTFLMVRSRGFLASKTFPEQNCPKKHLVLVTPGLKKKVASATTLA